VHYRGREEEARAWAERIGRGATVFQADFSEAGSAGALWNEAIEVFGRIDGLVNNAGIARGVPIDVEEERWRRVWDDTMAVNLGAAAELSRRAVGHFTEEGGGRIVTIASRAAFRGDEPEYLAYAASKGGLVALMRSIARGFGEEGVRAFILAPGYTDTEMIEPFVERYGRAIAEGDAVLDRMTRPEDVAPMAAFLLSGAADHATGTTIDINAGSYIH
jgi:NAD(P)-dependent dehydrogenase (short-subunit alcohol dehydrogenase family)